MIGAAVLMILAADSVPATQTTREAVMDFAACVDTRAHDRAMALLATQPGSDREHDLITTISGAYSTCLAGKRFLSFPLPLFRGELAQLAFQRDAALRDEAAALQPAPPALPDMVALNTAGKKGRAEKREASEANGFREQYARCIVTANPAAVAAMIPTEAASPAERAALLAVGDGLMRCIPQGIAYHINPAELRPYLISELYYRVTTNASRGG